MKGLVSIIIPAYNSELYIKESVNSALNQSYPNVEVIVVNDGSKDKTAEILGVIDDERLTVIHQDNGGVSNARNRALSVIKGEYFCFLDADDRLPINSVKSRIELFSQDVELHFVDGVIESFDQDFKLQTNTFIPNYSGNPFHKLVRLSEDCFFGITWMIKRNPKMKYHFAEQFTHGEDLLFYINIARDGGKYGYVESTTYERRETPGSAMSNFDKLIQGYKSLYKEIAEIQEVSNEDLKILVSKVKLIGFKGYLKNFQPLKALKLYFEKF